jgi:two-component system response regulator
MLIDINVKNDKIEKISNFMKNKLILVVEDNPDHLELAMLALEEHSADTEIVAARDGAGALDFLFGAGAYSDRDTKKQPDLVLLDIRLPKLSGLDVLRSIRANPLTSSVPVVMLTSSGEASDIASSYQSGANGFVRKPVDFGAFSEKLNRLQGYWLCVNESVPSK